MTPYSSCKALVVGVGRYADPQYDLSYARSDAEAMAELLGNEFGFDQVWTLYDTDATKQNIRCFFEQDLQRTEEDDGLLIFFAGHGITVTSAIGDDRGFLVPHDGNPDPNERYSNISLASIRDDYLPNIPAKHVFLIVDSCYGGLALRDVATVERPKTIDDALLSELTRRDRKVRQVLAAGTKDQRVLDGGLFGHSVFTGRLIEALREANPYITADHIGVHVRERVARDGSDRRHRQTPQFGYLIGGEGSFVFTQNMKHKAASILTVKASRRWRARVGKDSSTAIRLLAPKYHRIWITLAVLALAVFGSSFLLGKISGHSGYALLVAFCLGLPLVWAATTLKEKADRHRTFDAMALCVLKHKTDGVVQVALGEWRDKDWKARAGRVRRLIIRELVRRGLVSVERESGPQVHIETLSSTDSGLPAEVRIDVPEVGTIWTSTLENEVGIADLVVILLQKGKKGGQ